MRKKLLIAAVAVVAVAAIVAGVLGFSACSTADFTIGIALPMQHDALGMAADTFQAELTRLLEADGLTVEFDEQNANSDASLYPSIVNNFVNRGYDMIYTLGTDISVAAATATQTIPVLFNAVTDPVEAKLVASNEAPGANVTGVSDLNPIDEQVGLMQMLMGNGSADFTDFKVGVLYTLSEVNSQVQADSVQAACEAKGIECEQYGIVDINALNAQIPAMKSDGVDIIYIPTDNLLASNAATVNAQNKSTGTNLPIVCGETSMNALCGVATISVDYGTLGEFAAQMAYDILVNGAKPAETAVKFSAQEDLAYSIEEDIAAGINFTIPDAVKELVA